MAIYKFGQICTYVEGYVNPPINEEIWFSTKGMSWIKVSDLIHGSYINSSKNFLSEKGIKLAKNSSQIFKKGTIVWSKSGTVGLTSILDIDVMANRGILNIKSKYDKVLNTYLFYFLCKEKDKFAKKATGAVLKHFYGPNLMAEVIDLPSLQKQEEIIDIIEPFEKLKNNLIKQLNLFMKLSNSMSEDYDILDYMNKSCSFIKGLMKENFDKGRTLFLNVSAANGNPNKYCDNEPNVFPRDITLSLDGNTGLVNNNLLGFNGYLYKIESKNIPNWQIYYSLKHRLNQKIIKLNETGTTIKHSSNSKLELMLLKFKYKDVMKNLFDIEISIKNQLELVTKQINNLISLLIK